ncbi:alpha/beta hydrolase [Puniceicoccus vermicola]|uniref:Alpha/beta hydrolase n=1 Tax=Puniceicoccus vermicola TaxID=388746 RepID=A0A7X1E4Z0_9BACT|nr:alpha/beta hydrolase [Puniceicoccus vermicola]MBC2602508.1 hypothetical protein [Puniceicoccus vermicola]
MGATSAMYPDPWHELSDAMFHDWPAYAGESTIQELASRIIEEHEIKDGDTLIGSSLGGIVSSEVANQLSLHSLVLVGSAKDKEEIRPILRILHPFVDLAPLEFLRVSSSSIPNELARMFSHTDARFIRSMCKAIFSWDGLKNDVRLIRIHGKGDLVIPCPTEVEDPIDGGHLIAMTHPMECMKKIKENQSVDTTPVSAPR